MQPTDKVSLTYEQVQALGEVIKNNIGQARELTTDDYDYPTSNPTSVAAWLLAPGLYTAAESIQIRSYSGSIMTTTAKKNFIVLNGPRTSYKTIIDLADSDGLEMGITMYETSTSGSAVSGRVFLTRSDVINNLTSTSTNYPLSALQGKILNDKIEPLQALANYYTIEMSTGATWIDGSTIYKKTFGIGALPNASLSSTDPGISNIGTVIKIEGIGVESSGLAFPLPMPGNNFVELWWHAGSSKLNCQTGGDRSAATGYVTMYYTKSS